MIASADIPTKRRQLGRETVLGYNEAPPIVLPLVICMIFC